MLYYQMLLWVVMLYWMLTRYRKLEFIHMSSSEVDAMVWQSGREVPVAWADGLVALISSVLIVAVLGIIFDDPFQYAVFIIVLVNFSMVSRTMLAAAVNRATGTRLESTGTVLAMSAVTVIVFGYTLHQTEIFY